MSGATIELRSVSKDHAGRPALTDVSLMFAAGEITALLGASGSGKSSLLRLIAGLEPLDAGEIALDGKSVSRPGFTLSPEARRIGMAFQDHALFPHLRVLDNVAFGLAGLDKARRAHEALGWLDKVGLAARAKDYPGALSGGEQQRVALARALAPRPRAILLDEPFSGLDPALRAELRETTLLAIREAGATAVFVTHDSDEALYVADRLAILRGGRLVQAGLPREVYARPRSLEAAAALGPVNAVASRVRDGAAQTPFGPLAAPGFAEGDPVLVVARAEAVQLAPGAAHAVTRRIPQGAADLVFVAAGETAWRALVPSHAAEGIGARVDVRLAPWGTFVFPALKPDGES